MEAVHVMPRRRDSDPTGPTKHKVIITMDDILARTDMPQVAAASNRRKKEALTESPLSFLDTTLPFWDPNLWNVDTGEPEVPAEGCDLWFLCAHLYVWR